MATAALPSGLARKIKKTLETRTETPEFLSSLSTLSGFYDDNSAVERRKLRSTIEAQGLSINQEFLKSAGAVVAALDTVDGHLEELSDCCRAVGISLGSSKAKSADILAASRRVQQGLETSEERAVLVVLFLQQYRLSHDEIYSLNEAPIAAEFFEALERVRVIHTNCRTLLRGHHPKAGLDLLESLSVQQESAFERLCRWVKSECGALGERDAPEAAPMLQRAAQALRARPPLFRFCAEEVAMTRHAAIFQRFITALTRGGPGGTPRPIEMHAHDPRRYVGDMVAWVHQSLASEREFLVQLFGEDPPAAVAGASEVPTTEELLDRVFESICKPLKVRIEQVIAGGPQLLVCFRLAQLLSFYGDTIAKLAGASSAIAAAVTEAQQAATHSFREQLAAAAQKLSRHPPPPPPDLSPLPQVGEGLRQVLEVVAAFESAYRTADSAASAAAADFGGVVSEAVDPVVDMCRRSAQALRMPPAGSDGSQLQVATSRRVYLINSLAVLQGPLAAHAVSAPKADALGQDVESHMAALAGSHVEAMLRASPPADDVLDRIRFHQDRYVGEGDSGMAGDPLLRLDRLLQAAAAFVATVSDPAALPEFEQLQVPRLKADVAARVVRSLADAYEVIWSAVTDPTNGYCAAGASSPLPQTPEQIRTILGVVI